MPDEVSTKTYGSGAYRVGESGCLISIAGETGHFWRTIWDHASNAQLRESRADPQALVEGDRLFIPDPRPREDERSAESRHRFRRLGVPAIFRLRVLDEGKPLASRKWRADLGAGGVLRGTTDKDGLLEFAIPTGATRARIEVGEGAQGRSFEARFGVLCPGDTPRGIRQRLANLGFSQRSASDALDETARLAIRRFQTLHGLEVNGEADRATIDRLVEMHGS